MDPVGDRWLTREGALLGTEVLQRLAAGRPLTDLGLGELGGRIDLRGLPAPSPGRSPVAEWRGAVVESLSGITRLKNVALVDLDLTGAHLDEMQFMDCEITNCKFDRASCREWRMWAVTTRETSFKGADLRESLVGGALNGRANVYERVDFTQADLRGVNSAIATYVDCDFSHARIERVDFHASAFIRCKFAGRLSDVIFNRDGRFPIHRDIPVANEMEDVDFTDAELHFVEFRGLDLTRTKLPTGRGHVVVRNYRCTLERVVAELAADSSLTGRGLRAYFEASLRDAGPNQAVGVFHPDDFGEGDAAARTLGIRLLEAAQARCSGN